MQPELEKVEANLTRLARRVPEVGLASLTPDEQVALLAYSAHGLIAKGGFRQFYLTEFTLTALVSALRELKLSALANAAQATSAQFPDPALADDPRARGPHVENLSTDRQDYVFFRLSTEELLAAIAKFWKRPKV